MATAMTIRMVMPPALVGSGDGALDENLQAKSYWKSILDSSAHSDFPEMPPEFKAHTAAFIQHTFSLPAHDRVGISAHSLVCAAWALLVAKYTGAAYSVFGNSRAGLDHVHTITPIPLRIDVAGDSTVAEYLHAAQRQLEESLRFGDYGLQNPREMGEKFAQLCDFKSVLEIHDRNGVSDIEAEAPVQQLYSHAIHLKCIFRGAGATLECNYDSRLCSERAMARILKQFESTVLGLVAADPHSKTGNVNFLSDSDQDDIKEWNATMPEKRHECMHVCIDRIAEKRPFSPAICAWDGELSYRELEQHASALAQHLHITFHLVPDEVVLLHFEKSMWTAVCMYAVQKAGCAYGFLGLTDPIARMNTIVKTTKSRVVLTSSTLQDRFSQMPVDVVVVNQSLFDNMQTLASGFQVDVQPSNLAYILFTSGSTGVPKAVMVDHAAGTTSAYEHGTAEGVTADCRVLQFASYTFDVSTSETLTTLIMGGCVCIPSEEDRLDDLAGCLNHFGVNHTFLTPTVVSLLEPEDIPDVKTLKLGGEALTRENVAIWADKVQLSNSYGVCEAAIRSCFRNNITPDTDFSNCGSAVGCALWVTDPNNPNLLAHIGALGELIIEGPTLALGYMGDAQKTAEAFIEPVWLKNMFPGRPCRVYRTGDIVRYAEDGTIRFVGRSDSQVKINGQRVELREIEHHIMVMAREGLAAVVLPKKGSYKGKLVGLLAFTDTLIQDGVLKRLDTAAKPEQTNTFRELERTLIDVLPGYMVPRSWVAVEGLPINLSGKMNRLLLQDWVDGL